MTRACRHNILCITVSDCQKQRSSPRSHGLDLGLGDPGLDLRGPGALTLGQRSIDSEAEHNICLLSLGQDCRQLRINLHVQCSAYIAYTYSWRKCKPQMYAKPGYLHCNRLCSEGPGLGGAGLGLACCGLALTTIKVWPKVTTNIKTLCDLPSKNEPRAKQISHASIISMHFSR
mgnify:CR=1 FL=1